jgi:hypothetical protein
MRPVRLFGIVRSTIQGKACSTMVTPPDAIGQRESQHNAQAYVHAANRCARRAFGKDIEKLSGYKNALYKINCGASNGQIECANLPAGFAAGD